MTFTPKVTGAPFLATRRGVLMTGLPLSPASPPAPTWWAHDSACAWAAAWLTVRGRQFLATRGLLDDKQWSGDLTWIERSDVKLRGHCPDQIGFRAVPVAIEVELAAKSKRRLHAILTMHQAWAIAGKTGGVIYMCGDQACADRIHRVAYHNGLIHRDGSGWLRIELLDTIKDQTITDAEQARESSQHTPGSAVGTAPD